MRGIPFYAGLLAGIMVEELKKKEIKPSKVMFYGGGEESLPVTLYVKRGWQTFFGQRAKIL